MFLVKSIFSTYCRKFLVTTPAAVITKRHTDTLLSCQIVLSAGPSVRIVYGSRKLLCINKQCIRSVEFYRFISYDGHLQI